MTAVRTEYDSLDIGGHWRRTASDEPVTVISPHTGQPTGTTPNASSEVENGPVGLEVSLEYKSIHGAS